MDDNTTAGDGPISTTPPANPDVGMPGDSPLADAPQPEAPPLAPDSTEPAGDDAATTPDGGGDEDASDEASPELPTTEPEPDEPLAAEFAIAESSTDEPEPAEAAEPASGPPLEAPPPARRLSRGEREMVDRVRQHFAACGRCGYLIADFYLLLGEETLQTAAIQARDGWLRLDGDEKLRPLLVNAYGVRLDLGYDAMDGACPECRRRFVFAALEDGRVRLKLRT